MYNIFERHKSLQYQCHILNQMLASLQAKFDFKLDDKEMLEFIEEGLPVFYDILFEKVVGRKPSFADENGKLVAEQLKAEHLEKIYALYKIDENDLQSIFSMIETMSEPEFDIDVYKGAYVIAETELNGYGSNGITLTHLAIVRTPESDEHA